MLLVPTVQESEDSTKQTAALIIRWITTPCFSAEIALRVLERGPKRFMSHTINVLDLIAVVWCWAAIGYPSRVPGMGSVRLVRVAHIVANRFGVRIVQQVAEAVLYNPRCCWCRRGVCG